ncbi:MAG: hypothetical protein WC809_14975 [Sinimarinibacterium sp.]|jgi:hypothetical protein
MTFEQRLCRSWAVIFAIAGAGFLVEPDLVAALLNGLADGLGLASGMGAGRDTLWYPLALSLMAVLVLLAWEAGAPAAPPLAFRALLLSKLASTGGFAWLALTVAGGWWLCAGADGFVAATLLFARGR